LCFIYRGEYIEMLIHRHISHGIQGRGNHRKGRLDTQDIDDWRKKSGVIDSSTSSGARLDASNILVGEHQISVDAYERSGSYSQVRPEGESMQTSADSHAQVMHTPFLYLPPAILTLKSCTL
jgi:hypothetical protein